MSLARVAQGEPVGRGAGLLLRTELRSEGLLLSWKGSSSVESRERREVLGGNKMTRCATSKDTSGIAGPADAVSPADGDGDARYLPYAFSSIRAWRRSCGLACEALSVSIIL